MPCDTVELPNKTNATRDRAAVHRVRSKATVCLISAVRFCRSSKTSPQPSATFTCFPWLTCRRCCDRRPLGQPGIAIAFMPNLLPLVTFSCLGRWWGLPCAFCRRGWCWRGVGARNLGQCSAAGSEQERYVLFSSSRRDRPRPCAMYQATRRLPRGSKMTGELPTPILTISRSPTP